MEWKPIETAPAYRGVRVIGWCVFPAGAEAREIKCYVPLDEGTAFPTWWYHGVIQNPTHWMPLPQPPVIE